MAPMGRSSAQDGVLSPAYAPYYARRAAGGAALIIGEATAVDHPTAMHMHTSSTIHGRCAEAWAKVAEAVNAAGGAFMPQLWPAGLMRSPYPAADPNLPMFKHHKIGRAACRESVVQSVSLSVGGVTLKKKKSEN